MNSKQLWFLANYRRLLPAQKSARILEIGPGAGEICDLLVNELGYTQYLGVDVSGYYHQASPAVVRERITVVDSIPAWLARVDEGFDLVVMQHCLEHIPKAESWPLIAAIRKVLRPSGVLIVEVPNIANMFIGPYYRYSDTTHEMGFTDSSLEWTLRRGGFEPGEISVVPLRVPITSPLRAIQFALQWLLGLVQRLLLLAYLPRGRVLTSMYISAIAVKAGTRDPPGVSAGL